jgi:hypothetical protein
MILLAITIWIYPGNIVQAQQQQMPPVAESKANGSSKYNATSNCQFFVILVGIKPYQNAVGLSGTDYSNTISKR